MLILDRQNKVLQYVKKHRVATVATLAQHFDVHEATIRRDLSLLEKQGKLKRTHGGGMVEDEVHSEPPFGERESEQFAEKQRIGEKAATYVESGDNIILDSGSTTLHIARAIKEKEDITVITNDVNIAAELRFSENIKVIVTGGVLFHESYMLNGMITDEVLEKLHVNIAFIATPAFHHQFGLTHFDEQLVPAKRGMIEAGKRIIVVTDHTKIDRVSLHQVAPISEIDTIITTNELDESSKESLKNMDIDVCFV